MAQIQRDETQLEEKVAKASLDVEAKRRVLEAATELRDRAVLELYETGAGVAHIGQVAKLSKARVGQIIARLG